MAQQCLRKTHTPEPETDRGGVGAGRVAGTACAPPSLQAERSTAQPIMRGLMRRGHNPLLWSALFLQLGLPSCAAQNTDDAEGFNFILG